MTQNIHPEAFCEQSNIVKFRKARKEASQTSGITQFELIKAIYESGILQKIKSAGAKLVLIGLAQHYNPKNQYMYPSQRYLSEQLGVSERTVERAVAELKTLDLIDYKTQKVNFYFFTQKFYTSVKMSEVMRQNVGKDATKCRMDDRQNVGQTNKEEQKNNTLRGQNFYFNQPKGVDYQPFEPYKPLVDERTPETDFETAKSYVAGLWSMRDNFAIKGRLQKVFDVWGEENLLQAIQEY